MKRLLATCTVLSAFAMAMALSGFSKVFNEKYNIKDSSNLGKAACSVCHLKPKGGKLNPYGKDVQAVMKAENSKKVTPGILAKVEGKDSDGDGVKNLAEIRADSNPGLE